MQYEDKEKKVLIYPHEFVLTTESLLKVEVQKSYFKGNGFLIEAHFENTTIFFNNPKKIQENTTVFLSVNNELLKNRL
jgi:hypothetical protein